MIWLDVACNNPDNGIFDFSAPMLQLGSAEFECSRAAPSFFEDLPAPGSLSRMRLAGKNWTYSHSKDWVGNWCWNRYLLSHPKKSLRWYLTDFVTWLRDRELYSCSQGPCEFFDWFNGKTATAPASVHAMVCSLEAR